MNVTPDDRGLRWPFPVFRSLDGYRWTWLPRDVTAGILVVAIAISMGMAEVAGMPPIAGLYSCVLPLIAYALFGSSRQLVIALDASTAAMVALAVAPIAGGSIRYAALAGLVAVLVGLVLMLAGSLRLGIAANLLSRPVLLGYQAGLAMVVIVSQLPRLLGVTVRADDTPPSHRDRDRPGPDQPPDVRRRRDVPRAGDGCSRLEARCPRHSSRSWGLPSRWRSSFDTGDRPGPRRAAGGDPALHIPSVTSADVGAAPDLSRDRAPRGRGHDRELPSLRAAQRVRRRVEP